MNADVPLLFGLLHVSLLQLVATIFSLLRRASDEGLGDMTHEYGACMGLSMAKATTSTATGRFEDSVSGVWLRAALRTPSPQCGYRQV